MSIWKYRENAVMSIERVKPHFTETPHSSPLKLGFLLSGRFLQNIDDRIKA
ncbi:MAG: hypothetical protein QXK89_05410 [Candidatus Bathyarchaeia archaeon]|nr:hypothetical protein [Candidatus Bathyarchaeota archaeon]